MNCVVCELCELTCKRDGADVPAAHSHGTAHSSPGGPAAGQVALQDAPVSTLVSVGCLPGLCDRRWASVDSPAAAAGGRRRLQWGFTSRCVLAWPLLPRLLLLRWVSYKMLEAVLEADACAGLSEMQKNTSSKGRPEYTVNVTLCAEVCKTVGRD